ncbi:hypothetical protein BDN72DRAFT_906377 [Pluteus cervinus]|uniref:Uncharacterized protein n=1 Tax=Pluteus cervinus TaxID=181527 RepID=A0ACD2ZZ30_9AGAR|nr:hypothetical protein BDN72DRAFT_906377 [Pluteus cervinus]
MLVQLSQRDLILGQIEARETKELPSITQPYLPQLYIDPGSDVTSRYLFFQRIALKADVINTVIAQAYGSPDALMNAPVPEILVGVCETVPKIAPMEKRLDMHIDLLRRDELRERECANDVAKFVSLNFSIIEPTICTGCKSNWIISQKQTFEGYQHDLAERELGYTPAAIGLNGTFISALLSEEGEPKFFK